MLSTSLFFSRWTSQMQTRQRGSFRPLTVGECHAECPIVRYCMTLLNLHLWGARVLRRRTAWCVCSLPFSPGCSFVLQTLNLNESLAVTPRLTLELASKDYVAGCFR